jgi:hypothetical protein
VSYSLVVVLIVIAVVVVLAVFTRNALLAGFLIGTFALVGNGVCAWRISSDQPPAVITVNFLWLIFGGAFGWFIGILLSPYADEKPQFKAWGTALSTFLSVYVVSKFGDPLANFITTGKPSELMMGRALVFGNTFLLCMLIVLVTRLYWSKPAGNPPPAKNQNAAPVSVR